MIDQPAANKASTSKKGAAAVSRRLVVIANKRWELAPLIAVALEPRACPFPFTFPATLFKHPPPPNQDWKSPHPRAVVSLTGKQIGASGQTEVARAELWSIEEWMDPAQSSSSTAEKVRILPTLLQWDQQAPDFIVAVGTASFVSATSHNGCVVVGARAFIHNPYAGRAPNPRSPWDDSVVTRPIEPTLGEGFFDPRKRLVDESLRYNVEARLLATPLRPAATRILLAAHNYTALSAVNITNYDDYAWADEEAVHVYKAGDPKHPIGSLETTHAIIRALSSAPFLFVSGIVDRLGHFNVEVTPRVYAQNVVGAHNAGVAVAWLLPAIARFVSGA